MVELVARSGEAAAYVPHRGDLISIAFDPTEGHEQAGSRPALVLSHDEYNRVRWLAIVVPVTSRVRRGALEVPLPGSLKTQGVVLVDQVRCVAWRERGAEFIERAPASLLNEVLGKLTTLLR